MRSVRILKGLPLVNLLLTHMHVLTHCLKTPICNPQKLKNPLHLVLSHHNKIP
jgi:hypothetical protein